ncbi:Cell division protein kinase 1 [Glugoides intestinalis]
MVLYKRGVEERIIRRTKVNSKNCKEIGSGTFGKVYRYKRGNETYAIKTFTYSKDQMHITTLREIKALRAIKSRYVISLEEIIIEDYKVHLLFPFYEYDLYRMLGHEDFTLEDIKHIFWQILKGVEAIHNHGYLHRDLKTANILVRKEVQAKKDKKDSINRCNERNKDKRVRAEDKEPGEMEKQDIEGYRNKKVRAEDKEPGEMEKQDIGVGSNIEENYLQCESSYEVCICDFGMSRTRAKNMTASVVTLWYRSPEILLGSTGYSVFSDVWSLGCILVELINKKPLFKANTEIEVLRMIVDTCGSISEESLTSLPYYKDYQVQEGKRSIVETIADFSIEAADLADKMLFLDPASRISIKDSLKHPFFNSKAE